MSLTKVTYSMIADAPANVKDFGAVGDGVTDDTTAFNNAQAASNCIYIPNGTYGLVGFTPKNGLTVIPESEQQTILLQIDAAQPALNIESNVTTGQIFGQNITARVRGHLSATVEAVRFKALNPYAITRCKYDFYITRSYQAVKFDTSGSNIYQNDFKFTAENTQTTALSLRGAVYNNFDVFAVQIGNGRATDVTGFNNTFHRWVAEGQLFDEGQNNVYINPTIEELPNAPPTVFGMFLNGFGTTLINPTIVLSVASSANITRCIRPFQQSVIINPQFLVNGVAEPFAGASGSFWTLIGPGRNQCTNKMETLYNGSDSSLDLRTIGKVGNLSSFISGSSTFAGRTTQYAAPTTTTNINILNATDAMILEPTGTIATINFSLGPSNVVRFEGQTLSVYTSQAVTSATWQGYGSDTSLFPATLTAGQTFRMVYSASTDKWYPC